MTSTFSNCKHVKRLHDNNYISEEKFKAWMVAYLNNDINSKEEQEIKFLLENYADLETSEIAM